MIAVTQQRPDPKLVLSKAVLNAGQNLGLRREEIGRILGKDRSSISRGLDPDSKSGEIALLLIRCYRSLAVIVGEDAKIMAHWFSTENNHIGGIPRDLAMTIQGLVHVTEYLDSMRGKI